MISYIIKMFMVIYFGIYKGLINDDDILALGAMVYVMIDFTFDLFDKLKKEDK